MVQLEAPTTVNIRPDVGVLSVLRHLNYKPWYAIAEFVDNSLESYLTHRTELEAADGRQGKLRVEITIDSDSSLITIRDNAAGIYRGEYQRAFRPAEPPPQVSGLSEFGMGMKSAACWFGRKFEIRSSALGETVERSVVFDVDRIVQTKSDTLPIRISGTRTNSHYTEVILSDLHKPPQGRTISKIKEHLASIYRVFIREGTLEIRFRSPGIDEVLCYEEPSVLNAPPAESLIRRHHLSAESLIWRKDIQFDLGIGLRVSGFAAIRQEGSTAKAGFALFRRNRLIEGSGDESYRPQKIFGASTTAVYQRLFGELHLEGFEVSHTKDGFKWDENEEPFLDLLKEHLNSNPIPLIDQAREVRYDMLRNVEANNLNQAVTGAVRDTSDALRTTVAPIIEEQIHPRTDAPPPFSTLPVVQQSWREEFDVQLHGVRWKVIVEVTNDPAVSEWVSVLDDGNDDGVRRLGVSLSLSHPFMERFIGTDLDRIEPFVRLAAAMGLAEITARISGARQAGEMRRNINQLLRESLSNS
jgi:Histidine kinase-, DNA gyrase B-, and HSP90-like ATPase